MQISHPIYGVINDDTKVIPYVRAPGKARHNKRSLAYQTAKENVGAEMVRTLQTCEDLAIQARARKRPMGQPIITSPVRFGVIVGMKRTADGRLPAKSDWDNWYKAVLDAAVSAGIFKDDAALYVRGPAPVGDVASGIYAYIKPIIIWSICPVEHPFLPSIVFRSLPPHERSRALASPSIRTP